MNNILIFSGTSDGGKTAEYLARQGCRVTVSSATEYGGKCAPTGENITNLTGRMDQAAMMELMNRGYDCVVDATHPYANVVSENIRAACQASGVPYLRLLRETRDAGNVVYVSSVKEAARFLDNQEGNALLSTGSKELEEYTIVKDYKTRLFARVLSTEDSIQKCHALGFEGKNLIAMQGPFSEELNYAMLRQIGARWLVTKESGKVGGFDEKIAAARRANAGVIVISRPDANEAGLSFSQLVKKITGKPVAKEVALVGIGMGGRENMTVEAVNAMEQAGFIIGAGRMLDAVRSFGKPMADAYKSDEIVSLIENSEETRIAVSLSGDVGFYSGAKKLVEKLDGIPGIQVRLVPGISSMLYLCARLKTSWDDAVYVSMHGRAVNLVDKVHYNKKVFLIAGKGPELAKNLAMLCDHGLETVRVSIGANLSYENEQILVGTAGQLSQQSLPDLCSVLIENDWAAPRPVTGGIPDSAFLRAEVPMTKEEVRTVSLSKLHLTQDAVIYDVGAGTGSVSVEMAMLASNGTVYAVERKEEACELIAKNAKKFAVSNLKIVPGYAPEALADLPAPTHMFIGGSAGNMRQIVEAAMAKNPRVRIVINTIAMESTAEALELVNTMQVTDVDIVQLSVAKSRKVARYNMLTAHNPVYIISFTGSGEVK